MPSDCSGRSTSAAEEAAPDTQSAASPVAIDAAEAAGKKNRTAPRISVIIPARNEAATIERVLRRVYDDRPWEVIVVDGESSDGTGEIAAQMDAMVLRTAPGRGRQLNTGAAAATGDILLFLHADTSLPHAYRETVVDTLALPQTVAGAFRLHIDAPGMALRFVERAVQFRSRFLQMPYGDQAIFVRVEDFHRAGGYPDWPVMEDYCLVRRLRLLGKIRIAPDGVVTSGRRWKRVGVWRTTAQNQLTILAYRLGVSPDRLARWRDGH